MQRCSFRSLNLNKMERKEKSEQQRGSESGEECIYLSRLQNATSSLFLLSTKVCDQNNHGHLNYLNDGAHALAEHFRRPML